MLKKYFLRFSDPKKSCLKYIDFSTTYHFSYQKRIIISSPRRNGRNKVVHRVYPSLAKLEGTVHAPVLVEQLTHLIHPDRSYRLSYLLRQFADKTGKIHKQEADKTQEEKQRANRQYMRQKHFFLFRKVMVHYDRPRSNCLFCSVAQAVVPCCCRFFVGLANSSQIAACCEVAIVSFSSSTSTSG